jgi:hypothetical protein
LALGLSESLCGDFVYNEDKICRKIVTF